MARDTTERSVRRDPGLRDNVRDVQLNQNRRFFTARGSDSGVRQARALQAALGVGVDFYAETLERRNIEGSAEALQDQAEGKERSGNTSKGYEETYQRVEAANDLGEMNRDLSQKLTEAGWEDLAQPEAQAMIDEYFASQLAGVDPQSVYGQLMAEGILKVNADLLDVHNTSVISKDQQERRTMLLNSVRSTLELDGTIDYEQLMADSATLLPGRGGRMTFMEIVGTLAEELGRPDLLENIPDEFPNGEATGVNDPKFRQDWLNPAISRADQVKRNNERQTQLDFLEQQQTNRAREQADIDARADAGDASVLHDIFAAGVAPEGEVPLFTEAQQRAAINRLRAGQARVGIAESHEVLFRTGNGQPLTPTEYNQSAYAYAQKEAANIKAENPDWDAEQVQAAVTESVVERSIANDRLPKFITDMMMVSTNNPDRLASAADMRRLIEENSPGLVERSIDDLHSARLELYEALMVETGSDVDNTIEMMNQSDPSLSKGRGTEITDMAEQIVDQLADEAEWFGSAPVVSSDYRRAEELVKLYMDMGVPQEQMASLVSESFTARNVRVGGVLYPADFGWQQGDAALDWWIAGGSGDLWPEDANLVATPHPRERGVILIRNTESGLLHRAPYRVTDIENAYAKSMRDELYGDAEGARNTESSGFKEARRRAAERMFPDISNQFDPGSYGDMMGTPMMQFSQLTQAEQDAAIEAEFTRSQ